MHPASSVPVLSTCFNTTLVKVLYRYSFCLTVIRGFNTTLVKVLSVHIRGMDLMSSVSIQLLLRFYRIRNQMSICVLGFNTTLVKVLFVDTTLIQKLNNSFNTTLVKVLCIRDFFSFLYISVSIQLLLRFY